jgi:peptidoglycan/xylan/chitin deacetylase (PgdA/CDA1 family)
MRVSMTSAIQHMVRAADAAIASAYLKLFRERNALMSFLFHSLFRNEQEISLNLVDPLQRTTLNQFRQFIEYYLNNGYQFISPKDLLNGLSDDRKYALITFDDGYYSNALARPILEEYGVPAVFFISTNHVRQNKCFWWDALHRERFAQGADHPQIKREANELKCLRTDGIEEHLKSRFGPDVLRPRGDIDRPFSPEELREFASSKFVHLGNHTADHAILTNYSPDEVRQQVLTAQTELEEMTGVQANSIAYPNGANNPQIVAACGEMGLKIGFTVRPEKISLPLDARPETMLRLGRFCPHGENPMLTQCRTYRSDLQLYGKFRDGYLRLRRGQMAQ